MEKERNTLQLALDAPSEDYFYYQEFDSKDRPGSGKNMDSILLKKLTLLRTKLGYNLKINSGYRTPSRNARAGGVHNSAHMSKDAVDIRVLNSALRYEIVKEAILCGFKRIGIHKRFIHLDVDTTKQQEVIWMY